MANYVAIDKSVPGTTNSVVATLDQTTPGVSNGVVITNAAGTVLDTTLPTEIVGNVADASANTGKPVGVGGVYNSTLPTYTNAQRVTWQFGSRGAGNVTLMAKDSPNGIGTGLANADGITVGNEIGLATRDYLHAFNGTSWDRLRLAGSLGALLVENGPYLYSRKTADGQVKATAGFVHSVTIAPLTASPTAGLLSIYDSAAESGTVIYSEWIFATTPGHTVILDVACGTGIYVSFDATLANVTATVSYR